MTLGQNAIVEKLLHFGAIAKKNIAIFIGSDAVVTAMHM